MSNVDNRMVQMSFDNKQFEQGIGTSIKSLDNLKNGLNMDGATRGLSNLERAGRSFNMGGMADRVDYIANRFSALGIIGITAIQNLTNSAINAGKRIVSALTVDPIKLGLGEYESKIDAVQTILANTSSKGTTMDDVTDALKYMQGYADKTKYSLQEMNKNLGTFTAAGISLEESQQAIKGISNLAAVSGSNAQQASTAMYQLSQALSSGSLKLQDWNSVVNAGMGGQVFQDALKETARAHGIGIDKMIEDQGSFRETLTEGWISSEILIQTLQKFTGDLSDEQILSMGYTKEQAAEIQKLGKMAMGAAADLKTASQLMDVLKMTAQSGWNQTFTLLLGDFEEAKALFTELGSTFGGIIAASSKARNDLLQGWKDLGGRTVLIESLFGMFEAIEKVITPVKEAFRDIFSPTTSEQLFAMTEGLKQLIDGLLISDTAADNIKRTFRGLFAVLDIGRQAFLAIGKGVSRFVSYILPASGGVLEFTGSIGDFLVALNESIKTTDFFNEAVKSIGDFMLPIADGIRGAVDTIRNSLNSMGSADLSGLETFADKVSIRFEPVTKLGEIVMGAFGAVVSTIEFFAPIFFALADTIGKAFETMRDNIVNALNNAEFKAIFDIVNGTLLAAILVGLRDFIKSLTSVTDGAGGFIATASGLLDGVRGSLEAFQQNLKANILLKIGAAIALLAASLLVISTIDSEKLTGALTAISVLFIQLFAAMTLFTSLAGKFKFLAMERLTLMMMGMSTSILILAVAMERLAQLDWEGVAKGLVAVAGLAAILAGSAKLMSGASKKLMVSSTGFIIFAAAILILSEAVKRLGELDTDELAKGLIGVGVLAAQLALFMKVTDLSGMGVGKGLGLIALAVALNILASAVKKFSELDANEMIKGLFGIGAILTQVAIFVNFTGNAKNVITTAIGLTILAGAMNLFAIAIEKMGNLSMEQIGKGLLTMGGALVIVVAALKHMPPNMLVSGAGLLVIAGALVILSQALSNMGNMTGEEIAKSLVTLAGSLTIIATAMGFMTKGLPGAAALLVMAGALAILAPVLMMLGSMSISEIVTSLVVLAGAFAVIGGAAVILGPLTPVILGLAAAFTLFGIAVAAIGGGVLALSAGLAALAVSGAAGGAALIAVLSGVVGMVPFILKTLAEALISFAKVIGEGAPVIAEALMQLSLSFIFSLEAIIPALVNAVANVISQLLASFAKHIPDMVESGMKLIIGFLKGVRDNIKEVVATAIEIVINFIEGVASQIPDVIQAGVELILAFVNGVAEAIRGNTEPLIEAITNLVTALGEAAVRILLGFTPDLKTTGMDIIKNGFLTGISEKLKDIYNGFTDIAGEGLQALEDSISGFAGLGADVIAGFVKGMRDNVSSVIRAAKDTAGSAIAAAMDRLGIRSPSKAFAMVGMYSVVGLAQGIKKYAKKSDKEGENLGTSLVSTLQNALKKASYMLNKREPMNPVVQPLLDMSKVMRGLKDTFDEPPTIRPVLDLTDINAGLKYAFGQKQKISVAGEASSKFSAISLNIDRRMGLGNITNQISNSKDDRKIVINNSFSVRNEGDIRKINQGMKNVLDRYNNAKGVLVT